MERPRSVKIAVAAMWAVIVIRLAMFATNIFKNPDVSTINDVLWVLWAVGSNTLISLILVIGVSKRRRWARIGFAIVFILGLVFSLVVAIAISAHRKAPFISVNMIMFWLFEVVVLFLLFTKESNAWFGSKDNY